MTKTCGDAGGRKADGSACRVTLGIQESGLCRLHEPACAEAVQAARVRGGQAIAKQKRLARTALPEGVPKAPKTLEDAAEFASWLTYAIATGVISGREGHDAAYALRAFQTMIEKRDFVKRLEAASAEIKELKKQLAAKS